MTAADIDTFRRVSDAMSKLIADIPADHWQAATPCEEWDVRTLVEHTVGGLMAFVSLSRGGGIPEPEGDILGDHPAGAYRSAAVAFRNEMIQDDFDDRKITMPTGLVNGSELAHIATSESLVHGWDLARATNQEMSTLDDVAQHVLDIRENSPIRFELGDPRPAPAGARAVDRLAAFLGRSV
jgi:uncharacterized protein (TIGR03086 family)